MDWNELKVFLAIAEKGSLSGAATQLGVNHSTVFRRLQHFEETIKGRVFKRINNHYRLTTLGEELRVRAKEIEDNFHNLERQLVGKDVQPKGNVKITAPCNIACHFLSSYITTFNQQYPDITIELLISNQAFNMTNRQADIAVRATPKPPEHIVGRQVCEVGWGVFGSSAYKSLYGPPTSVQELGDHRITGATGNMSHLAIFSWLDKHFTEQVVTRTDDLMVMSHLAESGQSLAILPNDQNREGIEKLFALEPEKPSNIWLLTHPDLRHVERIKLVMEHLAAAFALEQLT
jgi:DNA-binding transcriptional LysR family regulator